ncbi:MAG: NAD(P)-binding domain-containing protein [Chryseolinea sp.]
MNGSILEVIVVGAGHAGLITSYYLKHLALEHMIFERGRIGETWRSQRWDNFRMITPDRLNVLQGSTAKIKNPDGYSGAQTLVNAMKDYVSAYQLPVTENSTVISIDKAPGSPVFTVKVSHDNDMVRSYDCWQVIVASGAMSQKVIPAMSENIDHSIKQLHSIEYKNASLLPEGGVLVVGGGQSGCDIAYDVAKSGRQVFLSSNGSPTLSRSYRGKDILDWLILSKQMESGSDRAGPTSQGPIISTDADIPFFDLKFLEAQGIKLLGSLDKVDGTILFFRDGIGKIVQAAREYDNVQRKAIDDYISASQVETGDNLAEKNVSLSSAEFSSQKKLDLKTSNISTIVWATGYTGNFDFIKLPVFNRHGLVEHHEGVTAVDGLYFVGFPWQRAQKSGFIFGVKEYASFVANKAYSALR